MPWCARYPVKQKNTIKALEQICKTINPSYPFNYSFLDQYIANMYKAEQRLDSLFNVFAVLATVISCLGLYGLSAYLAERRTRELGIRRVLGASGFQLVYLLSATFTPAVCIWGIMGVAPISPLLKAGTHRGRAIRFNRPPTGHFGFHCYR